MQARCLRVFKDAGLSEETSEQLAKLIVVPPAGTFELSELENAEDVRICLLGAIVAATRHWEYGEALNQLLQFSSTKIGQESKFDQGRLLHLRGFVAWRHEGSIYKALQLLTRSVRLLQESDDSAAEAYLPRVLDVFGQLLHHNGQMRDAQAEFELAIKYREASNDEAGLALSLGNLGRLLIDLGDFQSAYEKLSRDLAIVERISPEMTKLRSQLLTHLATSAIELDRLGEAKRLLKASEDLARIDENVVSLCYIALTKAQIALSEDDISTAEELSDYVLDQLDDAGIPDLLRDSIVALGIQVSAEVELAKGNVEESLKKFQSSRARFALLPNVSPVKVATMLRGYAKAARAIGDLEHTTLLLREALELLDASSAEAMRASIEQDLKEHFRDSWLLHSAGRFIGQKQIEFLLNEGGHSGFRGARKDVAIMFADIRGFTGISERFSPESLIVFLNEFLGCMTRCVQQFDGMVDKFIGDALMAVFSLPNPKPDDAENSMLATLMMQSELARFNHKMPDGTPPLGIGVGIHFGKTVAGLIGSPQKRSYTVIGDAVNMASRLEGMTKQLGATNLVTEELVQRLPNPDRFLLRPLGKYAAKGRVQGVTVYDLMGEKEFNEHGIELRSEIDQLNAGLLLFTDRQFSQAQSIFQKLAKGVANVQRSVGYEMLAQTSVQYSEQQLSDDWDGTIKLTTK